MEEQWRLSRQNLQECLNEKDDRVQRFLEELEYQKVKKCCKIRLNGNMSKTFIYSIHMKTENNEYIPIFKLGYLHLQRSGLLQKQRREAMRQLEVSKAIEKLMEEDKQHRQMLREKLHTRMHEAEIRKNRKVQDHRRVRKLYMS